MTEHLPECPWPDEPCGHEPMHDRQPVFCVACLTECICDRLRACEQRVLDEERSGAPVATVGADGFGRGYNRGYFAALEAVEQAIRDALSDDGRNLYAELTSLAAIDALKEKP